MVEQLSTIQEALAAFDKEAAREDIKAAERERQQILQRFPLQEWPSLPLERYALGQSDTTETYCYLLEFGSPHVGSMRGGSSNKHLVYKHKNKPGWYYHSVYHDEREAWEKVRAAFVQAFELAQAGQWEQIDELQALSGGRALRLKTLHVYFPDEILPISSIYHLQHFLQRLDIYTDEMKSWDVVRLNRRLLQDLRAIPGLQGWTTKEMERFLYHWADPRETRRIIKIAPGENAKLWDDCLANGYIRVGWDAVGDLRDFESEEAFRERFYDVFADEYRNHRPTLSKKAKEVWTLRELEPGDIIIANQGISRILAAGEVIEPGYEWRPNHAEYCHTVRVRWDTTYAQQIEPQRRWALVTVAPVGLQLYQRIISGREELPLLPEPLLLEIEDALERKGQTILYGPPGTGKTYYARQFAMWWLLKHQGRTAEASLVLANPDALQKAERQLSTVQMTQRVWWIVANPKEWGWDRLFRQGKVTFRYGRLQRNYPLVQPGDLVVGYQSTPDKCIMALARVSKGLSAANEDEPSIELEPLRQISSGPTYADLTADPVLKVSEPIRFRCQGTLFALTQDEANYLLALLAERDPELSQHALTTGESVGPLTWVTFHPSYSYEDFVEGFRPAETGSGGLELRLEDGLFKRICREAQAHPKRRYLLVVDEINRANLAKVFGELITLLEKDKRGMVVTLPQSRESFTIPPNVYLLGTMNTADRSIRLMDAALRRRFAFLEIMPDVGLLHGAMINSLALDDFLATLNQRIAEREGREKQIGHSLLLEDGQPVSEPESFARRFRQEMLPLLQEYCYDDYGVLASYLGDRLVDAEAKSLRSEILDDPERLIEVLAQALAAEENRP